MLGIVVAIWALPVSAWPICLAVGAVVGLYIVEYLKVQPGTGARAGSTPVSRRRVVSLSAFVCLAVVGVIAQFGAAGVLCVFAVGMSSPVSRARLTRWFPGDACPVMERDHTDPVSPQTASRPKLGGDTGWVSDAELCQTWAATYPRLARAPSAAAWSELIDHRAALLNELEQRDPQGFARWIASGARASSNPLRFLSTSASRDVERPPT